MDAPSSSSIATTTTVAVETTVAVAEDSDRGKNHGDEIIFLHDNNIKFMTLNQTSYTSFQLSFIQ